MELFEELKSPLIIELYERDANEKLIDRHMHEGLLQFFLLVSGKAILHCGSTVYEILPGGLFLINNNEFHQIQTFQAHAVYAVVKINLHCLLNMSPRSCQEKYILPLVQNVIIFEHRVKAVEILDTVQYLLSTYDEKKGCFELELQAGVYNLLSELLKHQPYTCRDKRSAAFLEKTSARFREVLTFLEENYGEPITLSQVAEIAKMSRGYFCSCFQKVTGRNFTEYLNQIRIAKAAELLLQSDDSVTDIAFQVGFVDMSYFSRVFRKEKGISPTAFRKEYRG